LTALSIISIMVLVLPEPLVPTISFSIGGYLLIFVSAQCA
jgi:hypothetical protein